jgi:hypothetical protein
MAALELKFLGDLEIARGSQRVELPPSRKTRALLAYLALTGRAFRREHLCELLWEIPDDPRGSLRWSLSKLRRMGLPIVMATAIGALFMFGFTLLLGRALEWTPLQSLFVAAMLMVSSSAVIAKIMSELKLNHDRAAQMALAITIVEDVVAVIMLTVIATQGAQSSMAIGQVLTGLTAFVVLFVCLGLLLQPRHLRSCWTMSRRGRSRDPRRAGRPARLRAARASRLAPRDAPAGPCRPRAAGLVGPIARAAPRAHPARRAPGCPSARAGDWLGAPAR